MSVANISPQRDFTRLPHVAMPAQRWPAWQRLSLRGRLLLVFILIDLIAALVAGSVTIIKARTSTQVEIAASMNLAEALVDETIRLSQSPLVNPLAEALSLPQRLLRHVRIFVRNAADVPVTMEPAASSESTRSMDRPPAPAWFAALIAPPVDRRELPIFSNGQRLGSILIIGEASDEIAEVWENTVALAAAGGALNLVVIALLYVVFGSVLGPLTGFARGLRDLKRQNYNVRLPRPNTPELGAIADRFNALAEALDALRAENSSLHRRLVTAQDDERRHTALELHDEVGPCLFGLKANATSIATLAAEAPPADIVERARDMLAIIDHLQTINRSLLNRLRPMALGHVPLGDLLFEVVRERARQHPKMRLSFTPGALRPGYGEPIDLTIYRCVQESLTNAIRHAEAARIGITLGETTHDNASWLDLQIRDDGRGIDVAAPAGRGLRGMQERVHALGGTCVIENAAGCGTNVRITVPLTARTLPSETAGAG